MSTARFLFPRGAVLALLIGVGPAFSPAAAQDILDDFKKDRKVAAEKLEKEVEQVLVEVQKLKAREPAKALGILNTYKHILEKDSFLTRERRDQLAAAVAQQIKTFEALAATQPKAPTLPPKTSTIDEEYAKYKQFAPKVPGAGSPYSVASKYHKDFKDKIDAAKGYNYQKQKSAATVLGDLDLGDIPVNGYASFPKDWKAKSDLRFKFSGLRLSEQEASLMKAMNSVLTVDFKKTPFQDVIDYLTERTGQSIVIDPLAMKEMMLDYGTPVDFSAKKISFRTVLKKVLGDVGLAYILKDGVVQVVTPEVARNTMTVRSYYIGDLLPPPVPGMGPFFNEAREQWFANQVMQMIVMTVEPQSWAINGSGKGTLWYNPASKSIAVRNSAELHLSLKSSMSGAY